MDTPRPLRHLQDALRLYPSAPRMLEMFRARRGESLPKWPEWCLMPMSGWYATVASESRSNPLPLHLVGDVARLSAIIPWRYTQGIYKFDPDFTATLTDTPISGVIPSEVLCRLPEWSAYIETPGWDWFGDPLHGVFAHLEWDPNTERRELRFLLDCEHQLTGFPLHIGAWTVTEAVDRVLQEGAAQASRRGAVFPYTTNDVQSVSKALNPMVAVVLYLCCDAPEIDDAREPGAAPARPRPVKTRRGMKLFPAKRPRFWTVGADIGSRLREAAEPGEQGRAVRPHVRRGHWHGYWVGPKSGKRKFVYRWISPLFVAGQGAGESEG